MVYKGSFPDLGQSPIGVLLLNLGTPDGPDSRSVRAYLKEFLSDQRVIERPAWLWQPILRGIILNTRPQKSAKAYQKIWTEKGSPLLQISQQQATNLQEHLGSDYFVSQGMRYGKPGITDALDQLHKANARYIVVLPLYPQYSATTTASCFDAISNELQHWRWLPELRFINSYYSNKDYLQALQVSIEKHWAQNDPGEMLLFSYHGIPQEYSDKGDPYAYQCQQTTQLLIEQMEIPKDKWAMSFQSRLGPTQWLMPYTDQTIEELALRGIKTLDVICPGFASDCLETLEEIAMENHSLFIEKGGQCLNYIPALNTLPEHITMMLNLIKEHTQGWID